jgi:hypothetical protein
MEEMKCEIIYSSTFKWNNYNLIVMKENEVINLFSKKSFLGCKVGKWESGLDLRYMSIRSL